jgi:hypothetical protein
VSVNQQCLGIIAPGSTTSQLIVTNGYDEGVYDAVPRSKSRHPTKMPVRLAYLGTVYANWSMGPLLDALAPARYRLTHCGRDQSSGSALANHVVTEPMGYLTDKTEIARVLQTVDAGIVRVGGQDTLHTTKVFDYVGADIDIIIITDGEPRTGALHDLTVGLDGVFWVRNEAAELKDFFATYLPTHAERPNRSRFSRRHQAEVLLAAVLDL